VVEKQVPETGMVMITDEEVEDFLKSNAFDEQWYVNEYADVKISDIDPIRHFLCIGKKLGRLPSPAAIEAKQKNYSGVDSEIYNTIASVFDKKFYLSSYPDIKDAGVDPIWHYAILGWMEGRDPSLYFSTRYYLDSNPDVREAGINPFYHFLTNGKSEGRPPKHDLGFRYDILSQLRPVAEQIAIAKANRASIATKTSNALRAALMQVIPGQSKVALSFSHDDFFTHLGGVQLLLRRELRLLQERDILQINFHPMHPLLFMDTSGDDILLGVTINGQPAGTYRSSDVIKALRSSTFEQEPTFIIHNLLGHNVDQVVGIIEASGARSGYFWIHDFAPLYNNFKLMRNDVEYCGVPQPGTMAWDLCEYARADFSQREECARLFDKFAIHLIAPSRSALAIWNEAGVLRPTTSEVIEHCVLHEKPFSAPLVKGQKFDGKEAPLKVGFVGHKADHKGWPVFKELVIALAGDRRYKFYHLGSGGANGLPVSWRDVRADDERPDRMREAVELEELDIALVWSLWPETFCLTAYEALAGGAAIITNKAAGNVCDLVRQSGEGLVLDNEKKLMSLFETGEIRRFARAHRTVRQFEIRYSELTVTCLEQRA
jgi:hypothetical protein